MKMLLLLRHGKSPHPDRTRDRDRPLAAGAATQMRALGRRLVLDGLLPDRVLASAAVRAASTARVVCEGAGLSAPVLLDELYLATATEIMAVLRRAGGDGQTLMLVGHNPGLEALCERLSGTSMPGGHMRTGALAVLDVCSAAWSDLSFGEAVLRQVIESH